jgi:hypothetical protein
MTSWLDGIVVQQQMRGLESHLRLQTTIAVEEVGMVVVVVAEEARVTCLFRGGAGVIQMEVMKGQSDVSLLL